MSDTPSPTAQAWQKLVQSLAEAGTRMESAVSDLAPDEQADGFRALARALANQLGRLEVDEASPELAPFNLWRQKFYMDNPDCLYWVGEISSGGRYRLTGTAKHAAFTSINAYAGAGLEARTVARLTSDDLVLDANGCFDLTLGGDQPDASGQWAGLPSDANMIWVRQFYDHPEQMDGNCALVRLDPVSPPPVIETARFTRRLANTATTLQRASKVISRGASHMAEPPNSIREWSEMQGGAVYTEPGIHYQRGSWSLELDQALVIEGKAVTCRHRSALLYSRFLNSLDYRNRQVSLAGPRFHVRADGTFRIVISAQDPGMDNWLDNEGRAYGLFVIRWLQPEQTPQLPTVRVMSLSELEA